MLGIAINRHSKINLFSQKYLLTFGVLVNLGILGYFKYANFLAVSTNNLFGTSFNLQTITLPLAISFFTFNQIAFLIDTYRGEAKEYDFLRYCLFITFFSHLLAGPIVHHKEMIPQLFRKLIYQFNPENLAVGITVFSLGLFKKVMFADSVAVYATPVFDAAAQGLPLTFFDAWSGALAYSLQLYFDFSGYSDMAIGVAWMFGIKFPLNFDSPYKAVNIIDFWRRWHITLSRFLRDYLYIPLGGNRKGKFRRYINLMITMLLGGLWHGAGWTYIVWGGLHGIYLVINHQWHSLRRTLGHDLSKSYWWSQCLGCFVTFLAVVVAWVFFRAENMNTAIAMLKVMVGATSISLSSPSLIVSKKLLLLLILFFIVWFTPNTQQLMGQYNPVIEQSTAKTSLGWSDYLWQKLQWQPNRLWSLISAILTALCLLKLSEVSEFLYFDF